MFKKKKETKFLTSIPFLTSLATKAAMLVISAELFTQFHSPTSHSPCQRMDNAGVHVEPQVGETIREEWPESPAGGGLSWSIAQPGACTVDLARGKRKLLVRSVPEMLGLLLHEPNASLSVCPQNRPKGK